MIAKKRRAIRGYKDGSVTLPNKLQKTMSEVADSAK